MEWFAISSFLETTSTFSTSIILSSKFVLFEKDGLQSLQKCLEDAPYRVGAIHEVRTLCQGNSVHLYDVILLFQSAQGERGCLKISKFERTYFMDGLLCFWKYSALTFLLKLATQFLCFLCNFISSGYISGDICSLFQSWSFHNCLSQFFLW